MYRRLSLVCSLLAAVGLVAACSDTKQSSLEGTIPVAPVGSLPDGVDSTRFVDHDALGTSRTTVPLSPEERLGRQVEGNRVIMLGDSVLASTAQRYSNDMCEALEPLGWQVEVDAESGRSIDWGDYVLDQRLDAGWDVGVIFLGNNYGGNQTYYYDQLYDLVDRMSPMPVVLVTVTEFEESRLEVNEAIFDVATQFPNVYILDWAVVTGDDPTLTGSDGLHLSTDGRLRLADEMAMILGQAPVSPGDCLPSEFTDDSMGPVTGSNGTLDTVDTTTANTKGGPPSSNPGNGSGPPPDSTLAP